MNKDALCSGVIGVFDDNDAFGYARSFTEHLRGIGCVVQNRKQQRSVEAPVSERQTRSVTEDRNDAGRDARVVAQ